VIGAASSGVEASQVRLLRTYAGLIKWSAMIGAIGWMLVYRLSEQAARIPEFVYVNF
jgi:hypothetical protein